MKRLNSSGFDVEDLEHWVHNAPIGDVRLSHHDEEISWCEYLMPFAAHVQQAFPIMHGATGARRTHVAVGFVDFGELAETLHAWREGNQGVLEASSKGEDQLKWVAVDINGHGYSCAKATVILQMLRDNADPKSIVQVLPRL